MSDHLAGLRLAVQVSPDDHNLRLLFAEALATAGELVEAVEQYSVLAESGSLSGFELTGAAGVAAHAGDFAAASSFLDRARATGAVEGVETVQREIDALLGLSGVTNNLEAYRPPTFVNVGGLDSVKDVLRLAIVEPLRDPERFAAFGRRAGGGVLLYGPPGCGKTLIAHATAGEANLPFTAVKITDVLSPYHGESERQLHEIFEEGRRRSPAIVIIDELESIGFSRARRRMVSETLVDQLLHELDDREGLLVVATTNMPWAIDDAVIRAGRFDTRAFVPPPDDATRRKILELRLLSKPLGSVDLDEIVRATNLFSGADLATLVEQAADAALSERADAIEQRHLRTVLRGARPTTLEWIATARRYVEFANRDGRWDDVSAFVTSRATRV